MKALVSLEAIADTSHRSELRAVSFDDYDDAQIDDEPNHVLTQLFECLGESYEIIVYTVMSEERRLQVETWLVDHNINADEVLMREQGDYSKNHLCALAMINSVDDIDIVFESDMRVVEACRDEGTTVLHV